jgi:hypothetical protein
MKYLLILWIAIGLSSNAIFAQQGETAVQTELNSIFALINKSQIPSGYLSEYGGDFVEKKYYFLSAISRPTTNRYTTYN